LNKRSGRNQKLNNQRFEQTFRQEPEAEQPTL